LTAISKKTAYYCKNSVFLRTLFAIANSDVQKTFSQAGGDLPDCVIQAGTRL
jgi:hypothetical protein